MVCWLYQADILMLIFAGKEKVLVIYNGLVLFSASLGMMSGKRENLYNMRLQSQKQLFFYHFLKGSVIMSAVTELVLNTKTLPQPIFQLLSTEKVKVCMCNDEIHLIPIEEKITKNDCPLLGLYTDGKITVNKHHEWSREDKRLEQ
jgi:hypothetical protein